MGGQSQHVSRITMKKLKNCPTGAQLEEFIIDKIRRERLW